MSEATQWILTSLIGFMCGTLFAGVVAVCAQLGRIGSRVEDVEMELRKMNQRADRRP